MGLLLQAGESADLPGGYGVALLQTLLALAAVCILAWVVLRWAAQKGLGIGASGQRVRVLERVALDARRSLWLVKVGEKVLLIGAGDGASPSLLAEMKEGDLPPEEKKTFAEVLRRAAPAKEPAQPAEPAAAPTASDDDGA